MTCTCIRKISSHATVVLAIALTSTLALAGSMKGSMNGSMNGSMPGSNSVAFEAKLEDGKKVWSPSEIKIESGNPVELKAHNSLPEPHGFTIAGYIEPQTIGAGETKTFTITPKKSEDLKVACHLHPAHVPATLKVK
jgi:plastocyanin